MPNVTRVPCKKIVRGDNDRTVFDPDSLQALAASIKKDGLQSPVVIRPIGEGKTYEIVAGERRFRAVNTILKWPSVDCIIRPLSDEQAAAVMLSENTGRKDLDPVDEAFAYQKRQKQFGWTAEEIGERAGVNADRVRQRLRLCEVRPDILKLVRTGQFPVGHAQHLADLDHNRQMLAARPLISGKRLNVREFRQVVDALLAEQMQEALFDVGPVVSKTPKIKTPTVPTNAKLPPFTSSSSTGQALFRYIETLRAAGLKKEAATVGTVLMGLVNSNCARLPIITETNSK